MVSGLAPGRLAPTFTVGKSTCGSGETGSSRNATLPASAIATSNSVVATGRRMNGSQIFMAYRAATGSWPASKWCSLLCEKRRASRSNQR